MKWDKGLLIVLLVSVLTLLPLFGSAFFSVHDATQPERVYEMAQALKDGQFPVRIVKDLGYGYGYPIFNFYAPLPYYFGGVVHALGVDLLLSTKMMFGAGILLAGLSMYLLAKNIWDEKAGILAAILYVFAPYHALDVYVRGAVGEFWAMGFLPFVLLAIYKIWQKEVVHKRLWLVAGGLSLAAVITSHNLTATMLILFLLVFFLVLIFYAQSKKNFLINFIKLVGLGLLLSSFYFLPALWEMGYTNVSSQIQGGSEYFRHFVYLDQLWDFPWGFGGSSGRQSGISFKVGKISLLLALLVLVLSFLQRKKTGTKKEIVIFAVLTVGIAVFFTNQISRPVWELLPFLQYLQFPWRFLIFIVLGSCLLGGAVSYYLERIKLQVPLDKDKLSSVVVIILVVATVFFQTKYFKPQFTYAENSSFYTNLERLNWDVSKISDEYLPKNFPKVTGENQVVKFGYRFWGNGVVKEISQKSQQREYQVDFPMRQKMTVFLAAFPGWEVNIDGRKIEQLDDPFVSFFVPEGKHYVKVSFNNTFPRLLGNLLSVFGICLAGVILISKKYAKNS